MRALRRLFITLFVLAVLFVAADRIAVKLAEDKAADKIKSASGVASPSDTSVDIQGFPFLTQVASRDLDEVDAKLSGMTAKAGGSELTVTRVNAQLQHVHINKDFSSAVADQAKGTAVVSYADLTKAAPDGVHVSWGGKGDQGKGRVKVTGGITVLGRTFHRSVNSTVSVSRDDTVKLHADQVPGGAIPGLESTIRKRVDFARRITGLPSGLTLDKVGATKNGIKLSVSGTDVKLGN